MRWDRKPFSYEPTNKLEGHFLFWEGEQYMTLFMCMWCKDTAHRVEFSGQDRRCKRTRCRQKVPAAECASVCVCADLWISRGRQSGGLKLTSHRGLHFSTGTYLNVPLEQMHYSYTVNMITFTNGDFTNYLQIQIYWILVIQALWTRNKHLNWYFAS